MVGWRLGWPSVCLSELHDVRLQLLIAEEVVAEGRFIGERLTSYGNSCQLEAPTSWKALGYVTEQLGTNSAVNLTLRWYGLLGVCWNPGESEFRSGDPEPGKWVFLHMADRQNEHILRIPRSDWFADVLKPIGDGEVLHLEVLTSRGPGAEAWAKTVALLAEADKAYALGDDAGVFAKLKGGFEALPGAPKHIFDQLPQSKGTRSINWSERS